MIYQLIDELVCYGLQNQLVDAAIEAGGRDGFLLDA